MKDATEAKGRTADKWIKWDVVAQAVIIAAIIGVGSLGNSFGNRVINGIDKLNASLVDIRKEMSLTNTRGLVNGSRLDKHEKDISRNTQDIKSLYSRK